MRLERFEEALVSYDRALTLRPDFAEALLNRGASLHELERFDEALASYNRALTLRPNFAEAHNNLGNTFGRLSARSTRPWAPIGAPSPIVRITRKHTTA